MTEPELRFTFNLSQCYLEVARGVFVGFHHPAGNDFISKHRHNPLANATIAVLSVTIIYSYLALEAFVNYRLFRLWERRHDGSSEAGRFLSLLGDPAAFEELRRHSKVRDLGSRFKTLCELRGYAKPHENDPTLWQEFKELVELSRHFLVHPNPGADSFQGHLTRIGLETVSGRYAQVAQRLMTFYYQQSGHTPPPWVMQNTLLRFRGIDVLADSGGLQWPSV